MSFVIALSVGGSCVVIGNCVTCGVSQLSIIGCGSWLCWLCVVCGCVDCVCHWNGLWCLVLLVAFVVYVCVCLFVCLLLKLFASWLLLFDGLVVLFMLFF